jgi:hypothetical protein
VLYEKKGDQIIHVKFTIMVLPSGNTRITGLDFDIPEHVDAGDKDVSDEIKAILALEDKKKKKKDKKKAKK